MATQSLVVSRDPEILGVLRPLMSELGMNFEVCDEIPSAIQRLNQRKYDSVIIDCDQDAAGYDLLANLRKQEHNNQKTVAVGITSDVQRMQEVFNNGATFVLSKPLPIDDARRILRASKGAITRAVRRFMRLPVENLSTVTIGEKYEAILVNVSQRGLQVQAPEPLQHGQMIYVSFLLPNTFHLIEGMAQVMWVDKEGRAGIELRTTSDEAQEALNDWVFARARALDPHFQYPLNTAAKAKSAISSSSGNFKSSGFKTGSIDLQRLRAELQPRENLKKVRSVMVVVFGVILDMLAVAFGTGAFIGFAVILSNYAGHHIAVTPLIEVGLGVGIAFWMIYRFLFFFFDVPSPGERAAQHMMDVHQRAVESRISA
jgi:CheY-like chemotaxis protein